jgi:dihydrolipoamide dehydrogenase
VSEPNGGTFDLVILGGGSGGYAAALRAAQLDLSVALIEKDKLGGTCLHRGCIPTKALLHAGEIADQTREAAQFGVKAELIGVDMAGVNSYKDGVVDRLYKGLQGLVKSAKITYVAGTGKLVGPDTVEVDGARYTGRNLVLATGSYARSLPGLEIDGERVITSEHALTLDRVPGSAIVLGGGVIGVEFASAWRSFGTEVTILEALPRLVAAEDADCSKAVERAFRKRGIAFKVGKPFEKVEHTEGGVRATIAGGETVEAELLLVAVGRGPVTANLGYEEQGLKMERGFVPVDERLRTNLPNVYAVGDIVPGLQLAHRGFQQGIFVAEEVAGLKPAPIDENGIPRVTYSDPEGEVRRGRRAHLQLQPRRQRPQPDPQDAGLRQGGRRQGRPGGRGAHGRRPGRRADRRGPADLQLGGLPDRRGAARARPPHPDRGARRGPPGAGRQAAARARVSTTIH